MSKEQRVCAIIPARGGSRSIPHKNIVPVAGKPMLVYSIVHAQEAACVDRIIVSTDDPAIADVARRNGAEVPFVRPPELSGDTVLDQPVFEHALRWLEEHDHYRPEIVVHLRPTSPIRLPGQIDQAVRLLRDRPEADSVRSVSLPSQHPYRMFSIAADGFLKPLLDTPYPEPYLLRRQDWPDVYWYNCVIDVTRRSTVLEKKSMTGARMLPFIMDSRLVVDIDSPEDIAVAEARLAAFARISAASGQGDKSG